MSIESACNVTKEAVRRASAYGNGVEAICFEFGDICSSDTVGLNAVNVDDEGLGQR